MLLPVYVCYDANEFNKICNNLGSFVAKDKIIKIKRTCIYNSIPHVVSASMSFIQKILYYLFSYKKINKRLHEVANQSLNWLRANALAFPLEFKNNLENIKKIRPLMEKAGLLVDFENFIKHADKTVKNVEDNQKAQKAIDDAQTIQNKAKTTIEQFAKTYSLNVPVNNDTVYTSLALDVLEYVGPRWHYCKRTAFMLSETLFKTDSRLISDATKSSIKEISKIFLFDEDAVIKRIKKSTIITVISDKKTFTFKPDQKVDFRLGKAYKRQSILVRTKTPIAKGGERTVYKAIDVLNNENLVYKRFSNNSLEKVLIENRDRLTLISVPCRGITNKSFYELQGSSLENYLSEKDELICSFVKDLVKGLSLFHDCSLSASHKDGSSEEIKFHHGDIKLDNIVVYPDPNGKSVPAFIDYGSFCQRTALWRSRFWNSPEMAHIYQKTNLSVETVSSFNEKYGQKMDVWTLGLVLAKLASKGHPDVEYFPNSLPPLAFLVRIYQDERALVKKNTDPVLDTGLALLTQNEVNYSINILEKKTLPNLKWIWGLVRQALIVNPDMRPPAEALLKALPK